MAEESVLLPLHWAKPAVLVDADQPVAPIRGIMKLLRRNQWLVLFRQADDEIKGYFPFRKYELEKRLSEAKSLAIASEVLGLPVEGAASVSRRKWNIRVSDLDFPERIRPVWLGADGTILGIGVPRVPKQPKEPKEIQSFHIARSELVSAALEPSVFKTDRVIYSDEKGNYIDFDEPATKLVLNATGVGEPGPIPSPSPKGIDNETIVPIFFGTDRELTSCVEGQVQFSSLRATGEIVRLGVCSVSIPRSHQIGHFEKPNWWKVWSSPQRGKHMALLSTVLLEEDQFTEQLKMSVNRSNRKDAFVFIHGYNVSFDAAALRTAQLAMDLQFNGAPILFSWPSKAGVMSYVADEGSIQWARPHLLSFISELRARSGAVAVHLIAHSMGNRALVEVLETLSQGAPGILFQQLILAAPDVDSGIFSQLIAAASSISERVTLYASSKDKALSLSKTIHSYARAGEAGESLLVLDGLDTIDATTVDTDFLGHSGFAQGRSLLSDMYVLLVHGHSPDFRHGLMRRTLAHGTYWEFLP